MSQITFEETENMSNQDFMSWVFENFGQLIWYTTKNIVGLKACGKRSCRRVCSVYYRVSRGYGN